MTRKSTHHGDTHEEPTGDIIDDLRAIIRDAEELLRATEDQVGDRIAEVRARAEESLSGAKERLRDLGGGVDKARSAARSADKYVHENPWAAVAIAVGVGFIIASIGRRR